VYSLDTSAIECRPCTAQCTAAAFALKVKELIVIAGLAQLGSAQSAQYN